LFIFVKKFLDKKQQNYFKIAKLFHYFIVMSTHGSQSIGIQQFNNGAM